MATSVDSVLRQVRRGTRLELSPQALLAAVCMPFVFLHVRWQSGIAIDFGRTTLNAYLSDFAVLAIALAALATGLHSGFAPLRAARWIWVSVGCFLAWTFVEVGLGRSVVSTYPWHTHAATAAKFAEYALLAPALPLVLRRRLDLRALLWSLSLWSVAATGVGIAEFLGASIFIHGRTGGRQGSFLSEADFAALSGAVLLVGLVALVVPRLGLGRWLGAVATSSGLLGLVLAAAVASLLGLAVAALAIAAALLRRGELAPRRALAAAAATVLVAAGVLALRGGDVGSYAHFLRSSDSTRSQEKTVQTYAHRTLLTWIGLQVWKDHPLLGAGWEASGDPGIFEPYLPAAHRRFPNEPDAAFPARSHAYGVQDAWVQALADLGVVGFALFVSMFGTVAVVAWRAAGRTGPAASLIGLGWTALVAALWAAQSFVAGIPLDAVTWLGFGLVAVGASRSTERT